MHKVQAPQLLNLVLLKELYPQITISLLTVLLILEDLIGLAPLDQLHSAFIQDPLSQLADILPSLLAYQLALSLEQDQVLMVGIIGFLITYQAQFGILYFHRPLPTLNHLSQD